jgi:hypothetical protein
MKHSFMTAMTIAAAPEPFARALQKEHSDVETRIER